MVPIYIGCVIVSVIICVGYFWTDIRRSMVQNLMLLVMLVGGLGYLALALSVDTSAALVSQKIIYISGVYLPELYFLTLCEVCEVKPKKLTILLMTVLHSAMYLLISTTEYTGLYYRSFKTVLVNGNVTAIKEFGPLHVLYIVLLLCYFVAAVALFIYAVARKRKGNRKEVLIMLSFATVAVAGYLSNKIFNLEFDLQPVFQIILILGSIIPMYHSSLYDISENEEIIRNQLDRVGFINLNRRLEFQGANGFATQVFEELDRTRMGYRVDRPSKELMELTKCAGEFLSDTFDKQGIREAKGSTFSIGEMTFDSEFRTIESFLKLCVGVRIELRDVTEHTRILRLTEQFNEKLSLEVEEKTARIAEIQNKTILGMAQMVESRDLSTGGHIKRTSDVVTIFSRHLLEANLGFSKHFLKLVARSAPMHDLGKIGVRDAVLQKQGKFTDEEYAEMKKHSEIGGRMVREILGGVEEEDFVRVAFNVANYHHEKVNGRGYPEGLRGEEIPIEARIMALADVFDALVSKRCYKEAFSYDTAFDIIRHDSGEHFDAKLVPIFLECRPELEQYYNNAGN